MTTQAQILANRRNAKKSTGPRTTKGKAVVARNALRHGLAARQTVIGSESRADFELYRRQMLIELDPESPVQCMLAERIISLSWRLRRTVRIQNQTMDTLSADNQSNPLAKLTRSLLRNLDKAENTSHAPYAPPADKPLGRMAIKDFSSARVLDRLLLYERRIEHSLYRTIMEFQKQKLISGIDSRYEIPLSHAAV
jgi:hypothetical protein